MVYIRSLKVTHACDAGSSAADAISPNKPPLRCFLIQATAIWKELSGLKRIVSEPRGTGSAFDAVMKDYYGAIETGRGAIMFAIFRGKVSHHCAQKLAVQPKAHAAAYTTI